MNRKEYNKFKQNGGINLIGRPAMDLLEELVRIAEEYKYPQTIEVAASHIKIVCNFSNPEYLKAREKLISAKVIKGYSNENKGPYGIFQLNYDSISKYSSGSNHLIK